MYIRQARAVYGLHDGNVKVVADHTEKGDIEVRENRVNAAEFAMTYLKQALSCDGVDEYHRTRFLDRTSGDNFSTLNIDHITNTSPLEDGSIKGEILMVCAAAEMTFKDLLMAGMRNGRDWPERDIVGFRDAWGVFPEFKIDRGPLYTLLVDHLSVDMDAVNSALLRGSEKAGIILSRDPSEIKTQILRHWQLECRLAIPGSGSAKTREQLQRYQDDKKVYPSRRRS
jgi:hypothetical protein